MSPCSMDLNCPPRHHEVIDAIHSLDLPAEIKQPFDVLAPWGSGRRLNSLVTYHLTRLAMPDGSFIPLAPGVRCTSPALLPLQMAPKLSFLNLVMLLSELMGLYAIFPANNEALLQKVRPLVSQKQMIEYLNKLGAVPYSSRVRRALLAAPELAASPMEAKLYLRFTFPLSKGGYGLEKITLNSPVYLQKISSLPGTLQKRKPDLLCLGGADATCNGVVIDYNGAWHQDPAQVRADAERANELIAQGFKPYVIWKEQYDDLVYMDNLVKSIRRDLGIPEPHLSREQQKYLRDARWQLWQNLEQARI